MTKELIEAIENLGNYLGITLDLIINISSEVNGIKQQPQHDTDINLMKRALKTAEYYYTRLHNNISKYRGSV